jgi:hypothetical protein
MKLLKVLSVMSLALFPLAPVSVEALSQPALAESQATPCPEQELCGKCGDGYCAAQCGETERSCPKDCGTSL